MIIKTDYKRITILFLLTMTVMPSFTLADTYNIVVSNNEQQIEPQIQDNNSIEIQLTNVEPRNTVNITSLQETYTTTRYNEIQNELGNPILVDGSLLRSGERLQLQEQQTYTVTNSENNTETTTVTTTPFTTNPEITFENIESIQQTIINNNQTFQEVGQTNTYNYTTIAGFNFPYVNRTIRLDVLDHESNQPEIVHRPIPKQLFNITTNLEENYTIGTDISKNFASVNVTGLTNKEYNLKQNVTGNASQFLDVQSDTQIFNNQTINFDLRVTVPQRTETGRYDATYTVTSPDKTIEKNITFFVEDTTSPEITGLETKHNKVGIKNEVTVRVTDNSGVSNVSIRLRNQNISVEQDQNTWFGDFTSINTGRQDFVVTAVDVNGNEKTETFNVSFNRSEWINISNEKDILTVNQDRRTRDRLFTVNNVTNPPSNLSISDFTTSIDDNTTVYALETGSLRIRKPDGERVQIFDVEDEVVVLDLEGDYMWEYTNNRVLDYEANLNIKPPNVYEERSLFIQGSIRDYNVPKSFTVDLGRGSKANCNGVDEGTAENSYIRCVSKHPVTTDLDRVQLLVSKDELDGFNETITSLQSTVTTKNIQLWSFSMFVIALIFGGILVVEWFRKDYAYVRRLGEK